MSFCIWGSRLGARTQPEDLFFLRLITFQMHFFAKSHPFPFCSSLSKTMPFLIYGFMLNANFEATSLLLPLVESDMKKQ